MFQGTCYDFHVWVWHSIQAILHFAFWAFDIDTTALSHTVVSSCFIPRLLCAGLLKVLAPISFLLCCSLYAQLYFFFFFSSHKVPEWNAYNKRFHHCTSHLSVARFPPFFFFCLMRSIIIICRADPLVYTGTSCLVLYTIQNIHFSFYDVTQFC